MQKPAGFSDVVDALSASGKIDSGTGNVPLEAGVSKQTRKGCSPILCPKMIKSRSGRTHNDVKIRPMRAR